MKQIFAPVVFALVAFVASAAPAHALTEYCPAAVSGLAADDAVESADGSGAVYSFFLEGEGERSVDATLMIDTDQGWFSADVPAVSLTRRIYDYTSDTVTYQRVKFESDLLYVRFPHDVTVKSRFVSHARATADAAFGWNTRGDVSCQAPAGLEATSTSTKGPRATPPSIATLKNPRDMRVAPAAGSVVVDAHPAVVPGSTDCPAPFTQSSVTRAVSPVWPDGYGRVSAPLTVLVEVAVGENGALDDAWVLQPSGLLAFDNAALTAAKESKYRAGTSFCQPAPGRYVFRADFRS